MGIQLSNPERCEVSILKSMGHSGQVSTFQPQRLNSFVSPATFPVRRAISGFVCLPLSSKATSRLLRER